MGNLLRVTDRGLFCPGGDFYIDPSRSVDYAVITHAHSDHARPGMRRYLCAAPGADVLRLRVGLTANIQTLAYGERVERNGVQISLHPAGHILGSAQVRLEKSGEVVVVSGDYKTEADRTCAPFEPIRCHTFVTESTFGLPVYRWPLEARVFSEVNAWWRLNQERGRATVLYGYSLGKSQRVLSGLDPSIGPIYQHPTLKPYTDAYRRQGVLLPPTLDMAADGSADWSKAVILAPPGGGGDSLPRALGPYATAQLSGWMAVAKTRRARGGDRGFVLSDHVDWPSLIGAVTATGAETVWVTHGYCSIVARYLKHLGLDAHELADGSDTDEGRSAT